MAHLTVGNNFHKQLERSKQMLITLNMLSQSPAQLLSFLFHTSAWHHTVRAGDFLSLQQFQKLMNLPTQNLIWDTTTLKKKLKTKKTGKTVWRCHFNKSNKVNAIFNFVNHFLKGYFRPIPCLEKRGDHGLQLTRLCIPARPADRV